MFFFYTILVISWFIVKSFWGKTAGTIFGYFNAVIGIFAFMPLIQDDGKGFGSAGLLLGFIYGILFVAVNFVAFIIVLFTKGGLSNLSLEDVLLNNSRSTGSPETKEYGNYVIQYRRGGSWIDGPGSNDERTAESMFDRFLSNDPRSENRCRLVYKVNGRVKSVLGSN